MTDDRDESPPRSTTAVVVAVTVVFAGVLLARVGPVVSSLAAVGTGCLFALSLWLVDREGDRASTALVGALAPVVGAGIAVAVGITTLVLVARAFPVPDASQVRPRSLDVASAAVAAGGATIAMAGALASPGGLLRGETAREHAETSLRTVALVLSVGALSILPSLTDPANEGVLDPGIGVVDGVLGALLWPVPGRTHLFTFLVVWTLTAVAVVAAVDRFPVAVLPAASRDRVRRVVEQVRSRGRRAVVVAAALVPVSLVEFVVDQTALGRWLGPLYGLLAAVTGSDVLRALAAGCLVAAALFVGSVGLLRLVAEATRQDLAAEASAFVGGVVVVGLVVATHGVVVEPTVGFVVERLPGAYAEGFERQADAILSAFGTAAVGLVVAAGLAGVATAGSFALALGSSVGSVPDRALGPALAATGLFVAAAFAVPAGAGGVLAIASLVACFVVWDAGEYGVTLGREVGPGAATGPVVLHLGVTVVLGAGLAAGVRAALAVTDWLPVVTGPALPVAFAVVVVGFVATALALR